MSEELILVTGASGFIATHIVQQLQKGGHKVRGTVRSLTNEEKIKPLKGLCPDAQQPLELVEADLNNAESWKSAVKGCTYVLHVASPFVVDNPRDENEVIKPAVDGTLNVLNACKEAKCVRRVILTSSCVAVSTGFDVGGEHVYTEEDWTDAEKPGLHAYHKSKTLAEKAAWDFVKGLNEEEKFELVVLNPSFVMGPVLCGPLTASMVLPKRLLEKSIPMLARLNFAVVDVRDVAAAHIAAIKCAEAVNHRHILSGGNMWIHDMAKLIDEEFKPQGYSIPRTVAPYGILWLYAWFDKDVKIVLPTIGKVTKLNTDRMVSVLGINARPLKDTILDMCYSMIESGKVKKTRGYKGPSKQDTQN